MSAKFKAYKLSPPSNPPHTCKEANAVKLQKRWLQCVSRSPLEGAYTNRTTWGVPTWRAVPDVVDPSHRDAGLHPRGRDMNAGGRAGVDALAAKAKLSRPSWRRVARPASSTASGTESFSMLEWFFYDESSGYLTASCSSLRENGAGSARPSSLVRLADVQVSGHGAGDPLDT